MHCSWDVVPKFKDLNLNFRKPNNSASHILHSPLFHTVEMYAPINQITPGHRFTFTLSLMMQPSDTVELSKLLNNFARRLHTFVTLEHLQK